MTFRTKLDEYYGKEVMIEGTIGCIEVKKVGWRETVVTCLVDVKVDGEVVTDHLRIKKRHVLQVGDVLKYKGVVGYYVKKGGKMNVGVF